MQPTRRPGTGAERRSSFRGVGTSFALPVNVVAPVISGTLTVGQVLSCTTGTWTGFPAPVLTYQWKRDGVAIAGETAATYTYASADRGLGVTCTVTATNAAGAASSTSNTLQTAPVNTVAPVVSGAVSIGGTLSTTTGTWAGADSFTYQWKRAGASIGGATSSTYTPVAADVTPTAAAATTGPAITCTVTAVDEAGSTSQASSNSVAYSPLTDFGSQITSTGLWLRGDVGLDSPSGKWTTQEGNARQFTANVAIATRSVNSLTAPDFNGTDQWFLGPVATSTILGAPGPRESMAGVILDAASAGTGYRAPPIFRYRSASDRGTHGIGSGGVYARTLQADAGTSSATSATAPSTGVAYISHEYDDVTTTISATLDGGAAGTGAAETPNSSNYDTAPNLGFDIVAAFLDGSVMELFVTAGTWTAAQRLNVRAWLARWGAS